MVSLSLAYCFQTQHLFEVPFDTSSWLLFLMFSLAYDMEGKQATSAYTSAYDEQDLSILNLIAHRYYQQQAKQV